MPRPVDADYAEMIADYVRRFGPRATLDDARYQDADGDLLADVPKDAKEHLDPAELVFSGIVFDDPEKAQATWQALIAHLQKKTGKPVRYETNLASVEEQIAALRDGKLHVTAFSTGSVPAAVNAAGFIPVCVPADGDGKYAYKMEIIVPAGDRKSVV
mgnify:CR=1 FL=1